MAAGGEQQLAGVFQDKKLAHGSCEQNARLARSPDRIDGG